MNPLPPSQPNSPTLAERHPSHMRQARAGKIDVLFLGDSITESWKWAGEKVWSRHLYSLKSANLGVSGERVDELLWRVQNGQLEGVSPKVVVLLIGTNNMFWHSAEEIAATHHEIVAELKRRMPAAKLVLLGILPRFDGPMPDTLQKIATINRAIEKTADGKTVHYLDVGSKLEERHFPDQVHLNERAYQIWADTLVPLLQKLLPPPRKGS